MWPDCLRSLRAWRIRLTVGFGINTQQGSKLTHKHYLKAVAEVCWSCWQGMTAEYLNSLVIMLFSSCLYALAMYILSCAPCVSACKLLANHRKDPLAFAKVWELGLPGFIQETIPMLLCDTGNSLSTFLTQLIHLKQQCPMLFKS